MQIPILIAAGLAAALVAPATAQGVKKDVLTIDRPWARETARGQSASGGFLTITNSARADERLTGGSTPVATRVEIHSMSMEGGVMRMRPLKNGLPVAAGGSVALKPGGFHIMFMGLKRPLVRGETIPVTLDFARAGKVQVSFAVEAVTYGGNHGGH
ncbi:MULTISPECIES: copper chaperone PCu(A)C [Sphingobium]|uniref:copper chaperone PCu(A)C n=1 Tax=Sphingobium TaxID=165695 RepID=UPI00183E0CA6|nr:MULTISPECIES: copper chaperone PCu(A)C [Sphingobium]MCW2364350.1 copper(I)-binding protein [Sphingobium sp. B10D3B]MCW2402253.1 copper(I)-binding protein [Sphingobium sp. B10D7B]MCW2409232.1 copper(I)-binding protein [Sphingobium xanthum]